MLDFVNPVLALGRLINRGRKLGLDEPKPGMNHARHNVLARLIEEARTVDARASSTLILKEMMMASRTITTA